MTFSPPTDPVRYARIVAVMTHCLTLAWSPRRSAERCRREAEARRDRVA